MKKQVQRPVPATTSKRLTPEQRNQILTAPTDWPYAKIAKEVGTSLNTVAKYRRGKKTVSTSSPTKEIPLRAVFEGKELTIRLDKASLLRLLADME